MKFLQYCKDKGVIDSIPAVSSTKYTYGHPAEVCAGELVEVAVAAVQQSVSQSGPVAENFASVGPEPAWSLEDFPDLHGMAPTAGKHAELLVSELSPVPRQVIILFFGPGGRPLRCLVDSGASRTFMLEHVGIQMALENPAVHVSRPVRDLKLRLADGQISVDFRRINEFIKPHSFRLPTCDSLWYTLDDAKYISTADAADVSGAHGSDLLDL